MGKKEKLIIVLFMMISLFEAVCGQNSNVIKWNENFEHRILADTSAFESIMKSKYVSDPYLKSIYIGDEHFWLLAFVYGSGIVRWQFNVYHENKDSLFLMAQGEVVDSDLVTEKTLLKMSNYLHQEKRDERIKDWILRMKILSIESDSHKGTIKFNKGNEIIGVLSVDSLLLKR